MGTPTAARPASALVNACLCMDMGRAFSTAGGSRAAAAAVAAAAAAALTRFFASACWSTVNLMASAAARVRR